MGEEKPHYVRPEAIDEIVNAPEPAPENVIGKTDDDIWGGYLAAWSKPKTTTTYAKPEGGAWSPAPFQTFDVSRYLLKGRETKTSTGTSYGAEGWWSAQPAKPAKQSQNWWDAWTADMPEDSTTNPEETYEAPAPA